MIHSLFCLESLQNSSLWQAFTTLKCLYDETDEYREGWEKLRGGESHGEDAFSVTRAVAYGKVGIVRLSASSFSSHTYSIHNISSMFGLTEINNNKKEDTVRPCKTKGSLWWCWSLYTRKAKLCGRPCCFLLPQIMSSLIADTKGPDALVSQGRVIVEMIGHGAISPHPLVSFWTS